MNRVCSYKKPVFLLVSLILLAVTLGFDYPARRILPLKDATGGGGSGEAIIERMGITYGQRSIGIDFSGLKPGSVYTVWLERKEPRELKPLGVDEHHFKTGADGKARYVTQSSEYDIDQFRWDYISIYYHPDGDPGNTKDMTLALSGDLKYGWHT